MKTILIADDEYAMVEALTTLLRDEGFLVIAASDGEELLQKLTEATPDLVLLDVMMPRKDGREALRTMRQESAWADVPVIVMSAAARPMSASDLGAAVFLKKPFELTELLDVIRRLLGP